MNNEEIRKQHQDTIKHLMALKFVTQTLLDYEPELIQLPDESESIQNSLRALRVMEFLHMNENDTLLNVDEICRSTTLSYTAQKALWSQLISSLREGLVPVSRFVEKMKQDLPHLYDPQYRNGESFINSSSVELLNIEDQRRECVLKLGEVRNQKIALCKAALELKLGHLARSELETLLAEMRLNQTKANLMCSYIINEFITRSEHSLKAIKEVESYIDKKLDEQAEEQKGEKV